MSDEVDPPWMTDTKLAQLEELCRRFYTGPPRVPDPDLPLLQMVAINALPAMLHDLRISRGEPHLQRACLPEDEPQ